MRHDFASSGDTTNAKPRVKAARALPRAMRAVPLRSPRTMTGMSRSGASLSGAYSAPRFREEGNGERERGIGPRSGVAVFGV
jgi:hypothetical protein